MVDEPQLVVALRRREPEAFATIFDLYADKIFRLACGILRDEEEAENIVQESFVRLFEKLDQFENRAKLGTWLYRVAHNASIDHLRKRRPTHPLHEEVSAQLEANGQAEGLVIPTILVDWSNSPELRFDSDEAQAELTKAINQLPLRLRSTFILREIQQLSTAETAQVLEIAENTVKVRLHRARLQLREHLSVYFSERVSRG